MGTKFKSTTLFFILIFLMIFFVACGGSEHTENRNNSTTSSEEKNNPQQMEEPRENNNVESNEEGEAKLEVVNATSNAWNVYANWVHTSLIVENTGDVPIKIGATEMDFKDVAGGSLGTSSLNHAIPEVIEPGQQAYITDHTMLDKEIDVADYKETTYDLSFEKTSDSPNLLEVSNIESVIDADDPLKPYFTVTATVTNTTDEVQDEVRIAAALYAEDGSFLGILRNKINPGLSPGSEINIPVALPDITRDVADQVETIDVKAYGR